MNITTAYKNGFPKPYQMILYLIFLAVIGFLSCFQIYAQETIKRSLDSMCFESNKKTSYLSIQDDMQRLQVILAYEVVLHIRPLEPQQVNGKKIIEVETIDHKIILKPSEINIKSDIPSLDFLEEVEEEKLQIEEWMIDPEFWKAIVEDMK